MQPSEDYSDVFFTRDIERVSFVLEEDYSVPNAISADIKWKGREVQRVNLTYAEAYVLSCEVAAKKVINDPGFSGATDRILQSHFTKKMTQKLLSGEAACLRFTPNSKFYCELALGTVGKEGGDIETATLSPAESYILIKNSNISHSLDIKSIVGHLNTGIRTYDQLYSILGALILSKKMESYRVVDLALSQLAMMELVKRS